MSKRKLVKMQAEIDSLQGQVTGLIKTVTELLPVRPMKPKLKTLDQSVFDKVEVEWQWAAIDKDGSLYLYAKKPDSAEDGFYPTLDSRLRLTFGGYDATNWQNSLIEREGKSELIGSDLCRAMLERGDKLIVCVVSDDRLDDSYYDVITSYDGVAFKSSLSFWYYATPIDNNGEPLTASEVGL